MDVEREVAAQRAPRDFEAQVADRD